MPKVRVQAGFEEIRFECQRCGSCCRHRRPYQFGELIPLSQLGEFWKISNLIYLTNKDIVQISRRTGLDATDFVDTLYKYDGRCVKVEDSGMKVILDLPVMKSNEDNTCILYQEGCKVYPTRPRACRLFPFRVEEETTEDGDILLDIGYNSHCPGIGKGEQVSKSELEKLVVDQFVERAKAVAEEVQNLQYKGKIACGAQVFRSVPGLKSGVKA